MERSKYRANEQLIFVSDDILHLTSQKKPNGFFKLYQQSRISASVFVSAHRMCDLDNRN